VNIKNYHSELNHDVVFGKSNGKIIWQPRIGCWYHDKVFAGEELPSPFTGMSFHEVYRELGCSARLYEFNECFERIEDPSVEFIKKNLNETDYEITISTPVGYQKHVLRTTKNSPFPITLKWEIETEKEMKVALWREENSNWIWNQSKYEELINTIGDLGAPCMYMPRMNVQSLYIEKMGVEDGVTAIYDWTNTTEEFFDALESSHDKLIDLINSSPIDIVNYGENVHVATLSPRLFKKYHLPACQRRSEKLHSAGKFVYSHWDGDCKPLLKFAKETGLDGIEAITPVPQGDVTIEEVKTALGDDLFLFDGIPAIYFDERYSEKELINCVNKLIDLFAPKLVLGISDEISSTGNIERVRLVKDIVDDYNSSLS
jgi:hypothetical protein